MQCISILLRRDKGSWQGLAKEKLHGANQIAQIQHGQQAEALPAADRRGYRLESRQNLAVVPSRVQSVSKKVPSACQAHLPSATPQW